MNHYQVGYEEGVALGQQNPQTAVIFALHYLAGYIADPYFIDSDLMEGARGVADGVLTSVREREI